MLTDHKPLSINSKASSDDCFQEGAHRALLAQSIINAISRNHESTNSDPITEDEHGSLLAAELLLSDVNDLLEAGQLKKYREDHQ